MNGKNYNEIITFRLYYEIWMSFIWLSCLIYMPLTAAFSEHSNVHSSAQTTTFIFLRLDVIINIWNFVDIFMWFRTGWVNEHEKTVDMEAIRIAK